VRKNQANHGDPSHRRDARARDQTEIPLNKGGYRTINLLRGSIAAARLFFDFYSEIFIVYINYRPALNVGLRGVLMGSTYIFVFIYTIIR